MPKSPSPRFLPAAFAVLALVALTFAAPANAKRQRGAVEAPTEAQLEVRSLRKQIAAIELAAALELSADQKAQLADLIAAQLAERETKRAEHQARLPELKEILEDYLDELERSGAPAGDTVEALRAFREAAKPDREGRKEARGETKGALAAILDEAQREALASFRPMAEAGPDETERSERRREIRTRSENRRPDMDPEDMEEMQERRQRRAHRKHIRKVVRELMFSPEFLEVLQD